MDARALDTRMMIDLLGRAEKRGIWPQVATRVLALRKVADSPRELARVVGTDPMLAARLLSTANQDAKRPVESLEQVVGALGYDRVCDLALALGMASLGDQERPRRRHQRHHAMAVGTACHLFSRYLRQVDSHTAYMAGLLHDLGKQLFLELDEDLYTKLLDRFDSRSEALCSAERIAFDLDHAALGGAALRRWKLPESIVQPVRHHHTPLQYVTNAQTRRVVEVIILSQALVLEYTLGSRDEVLARRVRDHASYKSLGLPDSAMSVVVSVFSEQAAPHLRG